MVAWYGRTRAEKPQSHAQASASSCATQRPNSTGRKHPPAPPRRPLCMHRPLKCLGRSKVLGMARSGRGPTSGNDAGLSPSPLVLSRGGGEPGEASHMGLAHTRTSFVGVVLPARRHASFPWTLHGQQTRRWTPPRCLWQEPQGDSAWSQCKDSTERSRSEAVGKNGSGRPKAHAQNIRLALARSSGTLRVAILLASWPSDSIDKEGGVWDGAGLGWVHAWLQTLSCAR